MRSITPIIAIVILLLMTIAAGGMAYLTISLYQEQASSAGSTGTEQAFKSMANQVKIESVESGRIILRNIGTQPLEDATFTAFIDNMPIQVYANPDCTNLQPGKTCTLDLPLEQNMSNPTQIWTQQTPSGNEMTWTETGKCRTVTIDAGVAAERTNTNSQCVDFSDLAVCKIDNLCEMDQYENGLNCPHDCGIAREIGPVQPNGGTYEIFSFSYNGTEWNFERNLTETVSISEFNSFGMYDADGNFMAAWTDGSANSNAQYRFLNQGTGSWTDTTNITDQYRDGPLKLAADRNGNIMLVMHEKPPGESVDMIKSKLWDGSGWGATYNVSLYDVTSSMSAYSPGVGYYGNTPIAVWLMPAEGGVVNYVQSAVWNGAGWSNHQNISTNGYYAAGTVVDVSTNYEGSVMAAWSENVGDINQIRSAQWNGTGWTNYQNVTDPQTTEMRRVSIGRDALGRHIITLDAGGVSTGYWILHDNGQWGAPQEMGVDNIGGIYLFNNMPGSIVLGWGQVLGSPAYILYQVRMWDAYSKQFSPIETVFNCTSLSGPCVDVNK